ncbi:protamine-3 [Tamandua tetradactyla]|uniref:protamine-3 n=1 Tax=Tamandua tetradactyla TaxID=48850 RepID=UPI004054984F
MMSAPCLPLRGPHIPAATSPPGPEAARAAMGSRCAKLGTGHGRSHESSMKKLVACVSQDTFSLSSEGEEEEKEAEEEKEEEEEEGEEEEEELPVQGKLLLMETERQEEGTEESPADQPSPKPKSSHS